MKKIALLAVLGFSIATFAQSPSAFPYTYPMQNDPTTGTVQFTLTCMTSSGQAIECSGGASNGYRGICVANCGKNGSAWIAFGGTVPLIVDGTTTAQHYIQFGSTAGQGHDSGASTYPTSGGTVIGQVQTASTGAASVSMVNINPEASAASSGSSGAYTQICKSSAGSPVTYSTTGGSFTPLVSCTVPANTLNTTGKCLHAVVMAYKSAAAVNDEYEWQFGATSTSAQLLNNTTSNSPFHAEAFVCETGTNTQQMEAASPYTTSTNGTATGPVTPAETTSGTITFLLKGACQAACATPEQVTPLVLVVDSY